MTERSKLEEQFLADWNYWGWNTPLPFKDASGKSFNAIPDVILWSCTEQTLYLLDYKGQNNLNFDGKLKGREAAEAKKRRYIEDKFKPYTAQRQRFASSTMGWNHSAHQKIACVNSFMPTHYKVRYVIVDPSLLKKKEDYLAKITKLFFKHPNISYLTTTGWWQYQLGKELVELYDPKRLPNKVKAVRNTDNVKRTIGGLIKMDSRELKDAQAAL